MAISDALPNGRASAPQSSVCLHVLLIMKPDQPVVLQVVIDGENGHQRNRLIGHRRQQGDPMHRDRRGQQQVLRQIQRAWLGESLNLPKYLLTTIVPASSNIITIF